MDQLVEEMRYQPECRGFDCRWGSWEFSLTYSFRSQALELTDLPTEMSTRGITWGVKRPVSRAENPATFMFCLEILGASTFWSSKGLSRPVKGLLNRR